MQASFSQHPRWGNIKFQVISLKRYLLRAGEIRHKKSIANKPLKAAVLFEHG
jgi:hypothetical protein